MKLRARRLECTRLLRMEVSLTMWNQNTKYPEKNLFDESLVAIVITNKHLKKQQ